MASRADGIDDDDDHSPADTKCSACGLPPRASPSTGQPIKLKRCSRCQKAWYHDAQCQRNHFPQHKQACRKAMGALELVSTKEQIQKIQVAVERRPDKGRCLVAVEKVSKGHRIGNQQWQPLGMVPPVLHPSQRTSRCCLCFGKLSPYQAPLRYPNNSSVPQYQLLFCSSTCRNVGSKQFKLDEELEAVGQLYNHSGMDGPPEIFSTAILLYRVVQLLLPQQSSSSTVQSHWNDLQHQTDNVDETIENESPSFHHTQAVLATVTAMIRESPSNSGASISLDQLRCFVNKIKLNGFSICDGESVALGVGIYDMPSAMNHSCAPNALQTFSYGEPGCLPSLMVTACQDIPAGQEVCIAYTDVTCPIAIRQERLLQGYYFQCSCEVCNDMQEEAIRMGLRCLKCSSSTSPATPMQSHAPSPDGYQCDSCKNRDFSKQIKSIESFLSNGGGEMATFSLDDMEQEYSTLKQCCFPYSWHVQESGERLVQAYLDLLGSEADNESKQRHLGTRALEVLEELRSSSRKTNSTVLRECLLTYKAAKLRLFLVPDPRQSMAELQTVLNTLSIYYDPKHEILSGLREVLQQAMC